MPADPVAPDLDVADFATGNLVDVNGLDKGWRQARKDIGSDPVTISLQKAPFLDNEALFWLLSLARGSHIGKYGPIKFDLPEPNSVRMNFLRGWRFLEALDHITGKSLPDLLTDRSNEIVRKLDDYEPKYVKVLDDPLGVRETLVSESFFALLPLKITESDFMLANQERSRWLEKHIVAVLDKQLITLSQYETSPGGYFATDVVYEAALNVARHPRAKIAYTSSQVQRRTSRFKDVDPELVLSFWDDGASFVESLRAGLAAGGIRSESFGSVPETFRCVYTDMTTRTTRRAQFEAHEWADDTTDEGLMVAAFLLGVTSEPSGLSTSDGMLSRQRPEIMRFRGAGLHLLRSMVVRELGGVVTYKSGPFRMKVSGGATSKSTYHVTVDRVDGPDLVGNLLTVRVPIKS